MTIIQQMRVDASIADYTNGMFEDGHNRTETNKKAHDAPAYDRAVKKSDPAFGPSVENDV